MKLKIGILLVLLTEVKLENISVDRILEPALIDSKQEIIDPIPVRNSPFPDFAVSPKKGYTIPILTDIAEKPQSSLLFVETPPETVDDSPSPVSKSEIIDQDQIEVSPSTDQIILNLYPVDPTIISSPQMIHPPQVISPPQVIGPPQVISPPQVITPPEVIDQNPDVLPTDPNQDSVPSTPIIPSYPNYPIYQPPVMIQVDPNDQKPNNPNNNDYDGWPAISPVSVDTVTVVDNWGVNGGLDSPDSIMSVAVQQTLNHFYCEYTGYSDTSLLLYGTKAWQFPAQDINLTLSYPPKRAESNQHDIVEDEDFVITGFKVELQIDGIEVRGFITNGGVLMDEISLSFVSKSISALSYQFWLYGIPKEDYDQPMQFYPC